MSARESSHDADAAYATETADGDSALDPAIQLDLLRAPPMPLSAWLNEIAALTGHYGSGAAMVADTGVCCWMDYYNDGYSPAAAWKAECDYD